MKFMLIGFITLLTVTCLGIIATCNAAASFVVTLLAITVLILVTKEMRK